jgi:hypothetical protein
MAARKAKTQTIKAPGKAPVKFKKGGLHESVGVPQGEKIPAAKMAAAKAGKFGPKAAKQANFAQGMLKAGRKTAAKGRKGGK